MTKIALKSDRYSSFGGIFYVMNEFSSLGMDTLIDRNLDLLSNFCGYKYSEIISSLFWIYFCGGDCIEDIVTHLGSQFELHSGTTIPSPDTLFRGIKELTEENTVYTAASGADYSSTHPRN